MEQDKTIYVHESHTLWSDNGEVYLACDNGTVVFNADALFNDIANLAEPPLFYGLSDSQRA